MEEHEGIDEFVKTFINRKADDDCKALTSFRSENIPKWLSMLDLEDCFLLQPLRVSFVEDDYALSFRGLEENKARKVMAVICDYIYTGGQYTIVLPLSFGTGTTYHTNVVLIYPVRQEYERFEPYGQYRTKKEIQSNADVFRLDMAMNSFMVNVLPEYCPILSLFDYVTTADYCPRFKAPQYVQEKPIFERVVKNESVDFVGFCTVWSMMYAHLRIIFPELDGKQVLEQLLGSVKRHSILRFTWDTSTSMTKLVQRYACFLNSL